MKYYQLLILGNGFDVHCGLQSHYRDFFRNALLDTIGNNFGLRQLRAGVSGCWENLLIEYYKIYGDADYSWCDVEKIIKETLLCVIFTDKESSTCIWKNSYKNVKAGRSPYAVLQEFTNPLTQYYYSYCMQFFSNLLVRNVKHYSDEELQFLMIENLLQELHSFEKRFCKYLKDKIINPQNNKELNEKYIINAINLLNEIVRFSDRQYTDINNIVKRQEGTAILFEEFSNLRLTNILSFNYTALFDILDVKSPCQYSNVHGKLCNKPCEKDCDSSSVIFGIDDGFIQSNSQYADLRLFSKTYRKMFDTSAPMSILPSLNENSAITIKFYGHSLNEADYSYFQSIFDYYNLYGNNRVALVFYYSQGYEQTDSIYRLINSYGKTLINQEQGKNLIHKLLLENRLKIVEIK